MKQPFEGDPYRPLNTRRRVLVVVLTLATASTVLVYMLSRRGDIMTGRDPQAAALSDAPRCKPGQTSGCVGGMAMVIVAPAAAPTAASASQASRP